MISLLSSSAIAASRCRHSCRSAGLSRFQSLTSRITRSGSALRYERVGLPGNFLSVTFGSFSNSAVGSIS
jgi:hypothetical protein